MNSFASPPQNRVLHETLTEPLAQLEWRVARRADEIARSRPGPTSLNLHCWLLAEMEICGEFNDRRGGSRLPGTMAG